MRTILVVAAHPDDEILGVGGTVAKHVAAGDKVYAIILGEGQTSRGDKRADTSQDIVDELHKNTLESAKAVGFEKVFFENFPDKTASMFLSNSSSSFFSIVRGFTSITGTGAATGVSSCLITGFTGEGAGFNGETEAAIAILFINGNIIIANIKRLFFMNCFPYRLGGL